MARTTAPASPIAGVVRAVRRWRASAKLRNLDRTITYLLDEIDNDRHAIRILRNDRDRVSLQLEELS